MTTSAAFVLSSHAISECSLQINCDNTLQISSIKYLYASLSIYISLYINQATQSSKDNPMKAGDFLHIIVKLLINSYWYTSHKNLYLFCHKTGLPGWI